MQKQHTAESRSPQVSSRTSADNTRRERALQKFRLLAAVKFKLSSDSGRKVRGPRGLRPLLATLPEDWIPLIEKWIADRRQPSVPAASVDPDLSIPPFLRLALAAKKARPRHDRPQQRRPCRTI
jgi:hypothetical protein